MKERKKKGGIEERKKEGREKKRRKRGKEEGVLMQQLKAFDMRQSGFKPC